MTNSGVTDHLPGRDKQLCGNMADHLLGCGRQLCGGLTDHLLGRDKQLCGGLTDRFLEAEGSHQNEPQFILVSHK